MIKKVSFVVLLALSIGSVQAKAPKPKERVKTYHICSKNDKAVDLFACSLYAEARGEKEKGMMLVGNVILNRMSHGDYPKKLRKVIYQKHQFSYISKRPLKIHDKESWQLAKKVATKLLSTPDEKRRLTDKTKGAIFYHKKGRKPYWAKSYVRTLVYKNHVFYKERNV